MMEAKESIFFRCLDCPKTFDKRMHYNRHRKSHEKPYPCPLCRKAFGLRSDRERHKLTHARTEVKFKCPFPQCSFQGTSRKDYLWKHMKANHQVEDNESSYKILRNHYEEAIRGSKSQQEDEHDIELFEAAREADEKRIRELLGDNSSSYDATTRDGITKVESGIQRWTTLHLAAREGYEILAKVLLERGADIHEKSTSGETALSMAIKAGHSTVAKLLLEKGASVHEKLDRGRTALHLAVRRGHEALVKMLLENGARVNESSQSGETALSMAVKAGHGALVRLLLENGADLHSKTIFKGNGITILVLAVRNRHKDVVRILIEHGSIPEEISGRSNALISAIETKQEDIVTLLIESGADVNQTPYAYSYYYTPLHAAVNAGPAITKLILQAKGDPEAETYSGNTPLTYAVGNPAEINNEVVRLLIEAGAKIKPRDWERFTPELREQYADRSPFRPLDPAVPSLEEIPDVDELLRFDRNMEDVDASNRDSINL